MKFQSLSQFALLSVLTGILVLSGCGATTNLTLPAGNWSMTAVPGSSHQSFYVGGNLTQAGTALAGTMSFIGSSCFSSSQIITFTGSVKGNNVTLTSASVGGEVFSIKATGTSGSALTGTYSVAGGTTCNGQTGTLTASPVPSITGTWSGPIVGDAKNDPNATLAVAFTQAATASSDGTFALTGTLTYTGSTCSNSGTIPPNSSFIVGPFLVVNGTTSDLGGTFAYTALLNNPAAPTSMPGGTYSTAGGNCSDLLSLTLTKQ